jgi:alkaline phosphatase D
LNRAHLPATEIVTLDDYRTRFRQYRSDPQLQLAHQKKPFICVWDDHEVTNNAYKDGAQNHQPSEGPFATRKANALKAYHEYIGVRTTVNEKIYRSFTFGNILDLHMLDTRLIGRDKQLDYGAYLTNGQLNEANFRRDWLNPSRTMLGSEQLAWLGQALSAGRAAWQVLGQQVLMAKMYLPAELASTLAQVQAESTQGTINPATLQRVQGQVLELVQLKNRVNNNDPALTAQERARISNVLPYNLDAWDGYPLERDAVLALAKGKKLIALAGDTHNAWYADLMTTDGALVGREVATPSVTSPGFEGIVGNNATILSIFEQALTILIDDLNYANISRKGYAQITFTTSRAVAEWRYVEGIATQSVTTTVGRSEAITA